MSLTVMLFITLMYGAIGVSEIRCANVDISFRGGIGSVMKKKLIKNVCVFIWRLSANLLPLQHEMRIANLL